MYDEHEKKTSDLGFSIEWLFKIAATGMATVLIIVGLALAYGVFTLVRDTLLSPEHFTQIITAWTEPIREEEETVTPDAAIVAEPANAVAEVPEPLESEASPEPTPEAATPETSDANSNAPPVEPVAIPAFSGGYGDESIATSEKSGILDTIDRFLEVVREGDLGRAAGGFIIFLFLYVLAKISLGILKIGADILIAVAATKEKKAEPRA